MNRFVSFVFGVMGMAAMASAAPVFFTDAAFNGAHGQASFTSEDYGITLTAAPFGAKLTKDAAGIGIDYGIIDESDEIDYPEVLTISFDKQVNLNSVYISKLFHDELKLLWFTIASWDEEGTYELSNGETGDFVTTNQNGELTLNINQMVKSIKFYAKDECLTGITNDFSVRGVDFTAVPEPTLLSLLGIGLIGLGFVRNRRK